tara:strand:+ start:169 stop:1116 length:948 start_codon:yes stop_codon:yes gene_type:complete
MACWDGYKQVGLKKKGNVMVPNCVPVSEIVKLAKENICVNCGNVVTENILDEDLRKWFNQKWVNIGKKDKSGKHPPCGTSGKKRGYAKCVPKSKAGSMSKKDKESATRRKRAAQNKAGRGGTDSTRGGGKKPIRVKTKVESVMDISKEKLSEMILEEYCEILSEKQDACYHKVKARYDVWPSAYASGALVKCRKVGAKNWGNKSKKEDIEEYIVENYYDYQDFIPYLKELKEGTLEEAEYQGRKVKLGKPMQGDTKKFKVYVKNPKGNVVKVNFGQKGMNIKKDNPGARKSFRARHKCDQDKPRTSAGYWSCRKW